jgi:hypothetical protein
MDNKLSKGSVNKIKVFNEKASPRHVVSALHQNVQSLKNKVLELDTLLQTELSYVNVLCFTEHWQKEQQIVYTNFMQLKLANSFCRVTSGHDETCFFVFIAVSVQRITFK